MACVQSLTDCVTQGNDWIFAITVTETGAVDVNGDPTDAKDLTGASIVFTLKDNITGPVIITPTQNTTDLATGRIVFSLTAAQTETLITSPGDGSRLLIGAPQVTYADGTIDDLFNFDLTIHESRN